MFMNYSEANTNNAPIYSKNTDMSNNIYLDDFQLEKNDTLFRFKNENLFTDVFIYVDGVEFPCHKVILCASSVYFQAMFSCDLKESRHGKVYIENMSPWTMKRLLDFIYTGKIDISYENVIDIFNAAVLFQLYKLVDKCINYVKHNVDLSNCIEINLFASMHDLHDLESYTYQFILDNFMQLINITISLYSKLDDNNNKIEMINNQKNLLFSQLNSNLIEKLPLDQIQDTFYSSFMRLSEKTFSNLLKSDLLNVTKEFHVYYTIVKWIEYQLKILSTSQKDLNKLYEQLFKYLRLSCLSRDELEFILKNDKFINEQTKLQIKLYLDKLNDLLDSNVENIRPSTLPRDYLCFLSLNEFNLYDFNKSKWESVSNWPPNYIKNISHDNIFNFNLNGYSVCTINNNVYVLGGLRNEGDNLELLNLVHKFDPVKNEWSSLSPMLTKRAYHHTIHLSLSKQSNFIFVLYGLKIAENESFEQCMNIEYYNLETNEWKILNIESNSILTHHLFALYNRSQTADLDLSRLINLQIEQSKLVVGLQNLIYILNDNCIHCFEFDKNDINSYLPYFRLPKNLNNFILAQAISFKTANILTQFDLELNTNQKSLFSWYSDSEDRSSSSSSSKSLSSVSSTSTNSLQSPTIHDYDDEGSSKRVMIRQEKEALLFILNPEQGILYEFYPGKNKLLKLPNLLLKHSKTESFILKIKSKILITGGLGDEEEKDGQFFVESYDRDTREWSVLTKYQANSKSLEDSSENGLFTFRNFFKLKMSLV
ncbi:unnamed protein product [Brachionus calyciflorus]|uniref:BTB domain-containing protein n=1 Tax=Brachionus calyciflorus TaxID=104777 RepID=A0A814CEU2_9BILA|nr:unnamed protein product [Brachionus calyciflorus]